MFVNNNKHPRLIKECVSPSISNNVMGIDQKLRLGFDGLTCTEVLKFVTTILTINYTGRYFWTYYNYSCTFHAKKPAFSINIPYSGEIHLHITGECLFIGITIQLCPKPYLGGKTTITIVHLVIIHACMQYKKEGD